MANHTGDLMPGIGSFADLMAQTDDHETQVIEALRRRDWNAQKFGQAQLTELTRSHLRCIKTSVRWMPDIIATKQTGLKTTAACIDAKGGRTYLRTENHDVQSDALLAAEKWAQYSGLPVYFVFRDWGVVTPDDVRTHAWDGQYNGRGSGTPFKVFPTQLCSSFDVVFGEERQFLF